MYSLNGKSIQIELILNVYDLNPSLNSKCYGIGLGAYHTGIQVGSVQYTFGYHPGPFTGVMQVSPKVNHPNFRESISLGTTTLTFRQINKVIDSIKDKFPGNSYHTIRKNCNTFTNCLCQAILKKPIPGFVNRLANIGKFFLEIDDFCRMRPYAQIYQTSANQLGVQIVQKSEPFSGSGTKIG